MYKEITEEDLNGRLTLVDRRLNEGTVNARELLKFVHTLFPLEYVMPDDFKGTHGLHLRRDGKLEASIWCNTKVYPVWED
jgi:hypothetical protein